jgi:hypothetical protein
MNSQLRSLLSRGANIVVCDLFYLLCYYVQYVTTINFVYRYIRVVWDRPLSGREYGGMLAALMSFLVAFFFWNYFLMRLYLTENNEVLMTEEFIVLFGGHNATQNHKEELRTCLRGDMVKSFLNINFTIIMLNYF